MNTNRVLYGVMAAVVIALVLGLIGAQVVIHAE